MPLPTSKPGGVRSRRPTLGHHRTRVLTPPCSGRDSTHIAALSTRHSASNASDARTARTASTSPRFLPFKVSVPVCCDGRALRSSSPIQAAGSVACAPAHAGRGANRCRTEPLESAARCPATTPSPRTLLAASPGPQHDGWCASPTRPVACGHPGCPHRTPRPASLTGPSSMHGSGRQMSCAGSRSRPYGRTTANWASDAEGRELRAGPGRAWRSRHTSRCRQRDTRPPRCHWGNEKGHSRCGSGGSRDGGHASEANRRPRRGQPSRLLPADRGSAVDCRPRADSVRQRCCADPPCLDAHHARGLDRPAARPPRASRARCGAGPLVTTFSPAPPWPRSVSGRRIRSAKRPPPTAVLHGPAPHPGRKCRYHLM
jgi:hypothetical protein